MFSTGDTVRRFEKAVNVVNETTRAKEPTATKDGEDEKKLTPLQVKHMIKSFHIVDEDKNKTLDISELAKAFRLMGQNPTKKELEAIMKEADLNDDGKIDEEEFTGLLIRNMQSTEQVRKELNQAFEVFDTHGDGKIDKKDLISTLKICGEEPLSDKEAKELVRLMDKNNDGVIDRDEFVNYLCLAVPVRFYMTKPSAT